MACCGGGGSQAVDLQEVATALRGVFTSGSDRARPLNPASVSDGHSTAPARRSAISGTADEAIGASNGEAGADPRTGTSPGPRNTGLRRNNLAEAEWWRASNSMIWNPKRRGWRIDVWNTPLHSSRFGVDNGFLIDIPFICVILAQKCSDSPPPQFPSQAHPIAW